MSDQPALIRTLGGRFFLRFATGFLIAMILIVVAVGPTGFQAISARFAAGRLHAPNLSLILAAPLLVQLHLVTVLAAFAAATWQMVGAKGSTAHRIIGWTFVVFMLFTALDALFIRNGETLRFSPIQIFSIIVLVGTPAAVLAARRHKVAEHARGMTGLYIGALILAGVFTLTPGRLLWQAFFG